jgi:hypothetical protein
MGPGCGAPPVRPRRYPFVGIAGRTAILTCAANGGSWTGGLPERPMGAVCKTVAKASKVRILHPPHPARTAPEQHERGQGPFVCCLDRFHRLPPKAVGCGKDTATAPRSRCVPCGFRGEVPGWRGRVIEPEIEGAFATLLLLMWLANRAQSHAVLPAFVLGLAASRTFERHRTTQQRFRVVAFALLTPFFSPPSFRPRSRNGSSPRPPTMRCGRSPGPATHTRGKRAYRCPWLAGADRTVCSDPSGPADVRSPNGLR